MQALLIAEVQSKIVAVLGMLCASAVIIYSGRFLFQCILMTGRAIEGLFDDASSHDDDAIDDNEVKAGEKYQEEWDRR